MQNCPIQGQPVAAELSDTGTASCSRTVQYRESQLQQNCPIQGQPVATELSNTGSASCSRTAQYRDSHLQQNFPIHGQPVAATQGPVQDHPFDKPLLCNIAHLLFLLHSNKHLLLDSTCSVALRTYQNLSFVSSNRSERTLRSH